MATSKEYLQYILDRLGGMDEISHRAMMGEYVIYNKGKQVVPDEPFYPVDAAAIVPDGFARQQTFFRHDESD